MFYLPALFKPLVEQPLPKVLRVRGYPGCVRVDDLHLRRLIGVFGVWGLEAKLATTEGFERFCTLGATAVLGNGIISNEDLLLRRFEGLGDGFLRRMGRFSRKSHEHQASSRTQRGVGCRPLTRCSQAISRYEQRPCRQMMKHPKSGILPGASLVGVEYRALETCRQLQLQLTSEK